MGAKFHNRVLCLGAGSVAQVVVPLLIKHNKVDPQQITVVDKRPSTRARFDSPIAAGINYVQDELTRENMDEIGRAHV